MSAKTFFISVDEHVQETPDVWTKQLSQSKWGDRIPHIERNSDGVERWVFDGRDIVLDGVADCGAVMADRTKNPPRWAEVPVSVFDPQERLEAMDAAGGGYGVPFSTAVRAGRQNLWGF